MTDIVAIDRIRRVWDSMVEQYPTATDKFKTAQNAAQGDYEACKDVTADEFFKYLRSVNQERRMYNRNRRHAIDPNGDFDDTGCAHIEREYRYNQKKLRGRL